MRHRIGENEIQRGNAWTGEHLGDGVGQITCASWAGFNDFVASMLTKIHSNVFRGQALSTWRLRSTLDRTLDGVDTSRVSKKRFMAYHQLRSKHLENFKYAARGRRSLHGGQKMQEDHWWALGQHYGLATPLLDWTESPYVAAYFAFQDPSHGEDGFAAIYCLSRPLIEKRISQLKAELGGGYDPGDVVRFLSPLAEDNARLINQRGLFTISPGEICLVDWIRTYFKGSGDTPLLVVKIPRSQRSVALRQMNRMNVSSLTLFPDLEGASAYCNMQLQDHLY